MLISNSSNTLKEDISSLRQQLVHHPLYQNIENIEHIRSFMSYHVFAVWDFMSLLKALQRNLTCVTIPWMPVENVNTSYLINEIVLGEESDIDENGVRTSHFELYLEAMNQVGASYYQLAQFFDLVKSGMTVPVALQYVEDLDEAIADFVNFTFKLINQNKTHVLAAVFTYGREDLIPDMFLSIVKDLQGKFPQQLSTFKYYLERHIEVDGDHHSLLAYEMTENLCKTDEQWEEATQAVKEALKLRIKLWDAVQNNICN